MLFVPTATPAADPTLIRRRKFGERYDVDSHSPSRTLFLTSNADGLARRAAPLSEQAGGAELLLLPPHQASSTGSSTRLRSTTRQTGRRSPAAMARPSSRTRPPARSTG